MAPGAVASLEIDAPDQVVAGEAFEVTVSALDAFGNLVPDYAGSVCFRSSDGAAVLPARYTFTGEEGGAQTFAVVLNTPGGQEVTVTDADGNTATVTALVCDPRTGGRRPARRPSARARLTDRLFAGGPDPFAGSPGEASP